MHFQHPELLYALVLLIIPLIVHLFRLRKFQREDFTNVKFLKKVIQETRKSSRLKKFLILATRLFLLACLILAFAQPYIPASESALQDTKTLIYLDNSYSMQASEGQSSLLQKAVNQLLAGLEEDNNYDLFTNDAEYFNRSVEELKTELQQIEFTDENINFRELMLKAENHFQEETTARKEFILISDFQQNMNFPNELEADHINYHFIENRVPEMVNVSLDTAFIRNANPENIDLFIRLSSNSAIDEPVAVSIRNGENLLGRNTLEFKEDNSAQISFRLPNEQTENGIIEIEDSGLQYDNRLFFNISEKRAVQTVIISSSDDSFLKRIYNEPEFETTSFSPSQIDFNQLNSANLIVLNEIEQLPTSLVNNLSNFNRQGTSVVIIPSSDGTEYTPLLNSLGFSAFREKIETERLITSIEYDHPLLEGVFEDRTDNFEYPKVLQSFNISAGSAILEYEDNFPFLVTNNSAYLFTAALNNENSNFRNSPLIVPVLYQIGLEALKKNQLYFQTDRENRVDIPISLGKDKVLHLSNNENDIIPQQQNFSNRVEISTANLLLEAGNYNISEESRQVGNISFNYNRSESQLEYSDISEIGGAKIHNSVEDYFSETNAATQINALWKWFVIFALIFLGIETLLIKFFK